MPNHYIPNIHVKIVPASTVPYIAVKAEWRGRDGMPHGHQIVLHADEFKEKIALVVGQLIQEVLEIEEKFNDSE